MRHVICAFIFLLLAAASLAHEHTAATAPEDRKFLDTLQRPDNHKYPDRNHSGTHDSRLCCTQQDAVQVEYEMVIPEGERYPEPEWYVLIDLDGTGKKRVRVPPDKINDEYAPSGQAYAFILGGTIQCFVRPLPRF